MVVYYAGCDVGSSVVRLGLLNEEGLLEFMEKETITYHQDKTDSRFVTQSSTQIWDSFQKCWDRVVSKVPKGSIKSIAFAATCSMVVTKRVNNELVPYAADHGLNDHDQNVVFWMDSRASQETNEINDILKDDEILRFYGGNFISEMGIPKVKYLVDHIPNEELKDIVFFDLHDYLSYKFAQGERRTLNREFTISNTATQRALDGELKGWSASFLSKIGLSHLSANNFQAIGKLELSTSSSYSAIPLAGSLLAVRGSISIAQGVIDSYAGWIGSCGKVVENSLTMVAGTSTCFLIGHHSNRSIPGIWGPFEGIFGNMYVSEGGQSTTGKLFEHLFDTHPAYSQLMKNGDNVFEALEELIAKKEQVTGTSIHFSAKHAHLYGDLAGNRTPYGDGAMRGVFFGESVDTSVNDLVLKYVTILEFLAFQTRQTVNLMKEYDIRKIVICGSQARNKRLVKLIADVVGIPVEVSGTDPDLAGVQGAAYLGASGYTKKPLIDIIRLFNNCGEVTKPEIEFSHARLKRLLDEKYKIMIDIAERQRLYNSWIDNVL